MKKRALSWLLAVVMVVSLAPQIIPKAEAAEKDAFGITLSEDNSFHAGDLENNPYGTAGWFSLITHSELVETRTKRDRARNQYVYRYTGLDSRTEESSFSQPKNYTLIATAAFDADGDGRKELVANLAYDKANKQLQLYTTDSNGQKGTTKNLESADFLQKVWSYHATSHMAIAAGDFDGDGKDTVVVYQPNGLKLVEYEWNGSWSSKGEVTHIGRTLGDKGEDRLKWVMDNDNDGGGDELRATPSVQLAVDDTDKDGKDELVVASSWNDLEQDNYKYDGTKHNANWQCSWVSVFDKDSGWNRTFNQVLQSEGNNAEGQSETKSGRLRFAGVTVGNVEKTTGDVDAPEIICVGYPDQSSGDGCDVNEGEFGIYTFRYSQDDKGKGQYARILADNRVPANEFSKGGCYDSDKIQDPVAVVAFASRGNTYADDLFIEGTVYRYDGVGSSGTFNRQWNHSYFDDDDDGINRFIISNGGVSQAIAANFTGDINGREEVVFSTVQKYKHGTGHFWRTRMYCNTGTQSGSTWVDNWSQKDYGWSLYHDGESQTALTAADIGVNDGTQAKIKSKTRSYTDPQVMAILEAPPYFAEIAEGDIGNGTTAYGKAKTTGESKTDSTSVSLGAMVGFEYEDPITNTGGGFEATISNEWTWETTESVEREISTTYSNDSGDNAVVVFRTPVVTYEYEVRGYAAGATKNNRMAIGIQGQPAHSMISVDDYNAAADQFGLDRITDDMIGSAGNPSSYHQGLPSSKKSIQSWTSEKQYSYAGSGTIEQSVTNTKSTEESSSYSFNAEVSAFVSICGVKGGLSAGGGFGSGTTTMNSESTSKTGAVSARPNVTNAENYNFNWQFATWTQHLNGDEVPVLGYLVNSIIAPPSPAENLALSEHSKNSMKLTWEAGDRPANEYRVYRYDPTNPYSDYTLLGTVSGGLANEGGVYEYQLTGLAPSTTYQYVITGYSLTNGESVYSEVATGTTLADSGKSLVLNELKDQSALIGEDAVFQVDVASYGDYNSLGYRWQEKLPGSNWKDAENGDASTLRVTATGERSGAQYRCIVYGKSQAGDAVPYYTNAAKLTIGQNIHPSLTIDNHDSGSGTQAEPYTGTANYPILTPKFEKETVDGVQPSVEVTVEEEQKEALVYKAGDQLVATVVDKNNKTRYFAVTKTGTAPNEVYTKGNELSYSVVTNFKKGDAEYSGWPETTVHDGVLQPLSVKIGDKTYYRYIGVKGTFENYTLPQYDANGDLTNAGQITTTPVEAKLKTVTELDNQYISADGRTFYAYTEGMSSLPAEETLPDGITAMELYQSETSGVTLVGHLDQDLYYTPASDSGETATRASWDVVSKYRLYEIEKKMSGEGETTTTYTLAEITYTTTETLSGTDFAIVTKPILTPETTSVVRDVTTYTESTNEGKQLTLSVTASKGTTDGTAAANADYTIRLVNQSTGAVTTLTGKTRADGTATQKWTADAPGLYAIQVITGNNVTPTQYYLAKGPDDLYSLTAEDSNGNVVTTATYGDTVSLKTSAITTAGTMNDYTDSGLAYSYSVNGNEETQIPTPSAFKLPEVGTFTLYVKKDNKTLASTVLTVEKRAIILEPTWTNESTGGPPEELIDITPKADNLASGESLGNIVQVVCSLYKNGTLDKTQSGAFTVSLDYVKDGEDKYTAAVQSFLSHYQVTLKTAQILRKLDTFPIYYEAGENGELEGRWGDGGNSFASGSLIEKDQPLRFQATPNGGYVVDSWTVNGTKIDTNNADYKLSDDRTILTVNSFSDDMLDSNQQMKVVVSFKSDKHTISYHVNDGNGTLTAKSSDNNPVANGGKVAEGTSVTFTAEPDTGYSVEKWVVDDVEYTWPDSKALYRSKTLILENISKSHKVEVYFTDKAAIQISTSLIHEDGNATSAAEITVADVTDASKTLDLNNIESGSSLLFTAIPNNTNIGVKKWQISTDNGQTWTTVTGSGGQLSCTLYNLTESTQVRAVLTTAQSYGLTFKVQKDGQEVPDSIATLTAKINNLALTSGHSQPAYSQVDFELELSEDYYVVGWTGASNAEGNKTTSAKLDSLTETTTVIVNIQEKPKVTVTTPANGTVEVTGIRTGTGAVTLNGSSDENGHVDLNSKVTISAKPTAGYFVKNIVVTVDGKAQTTDYDTEENYQAGAVTLKDIEITKNTSIQVNFAQKPVVTFTGNGKITVTAMQGDKKLTSGGWVEKFSDNIVFTATPEKGWETKEWNVTGWTQENNTANDNTTYTKQGEITSDVTVSATAEEIPQYRLTLSVKKLGGDTNGGTISANITRKALSVYDGTISNTGKFYRDSNIAIVPHPEAGYRVQSYTWNVNGTNGTNGSGETIPENLLKNVQGDVQIEVCYVKLGTGISFGPLNGKTGSENGYISAAKLTEGDKHSVMDQAGGTQITAGGIDFKAAPAAGYEVEGWYKTTGSTDTRIDSMGDADDKREFTFTPESGDTTVYIHPKFRQVEYDITTADDVTVSPSLTNGKARGGTALTFTAPSKAGQNVTGWTINGTAVTTGTTGMNGNTLTWTVENGHLSDPAVTSYDVQPTYEKGAYTVRYDQPQNGKLTATATAGDPVAGNTQVTFTAAPDAHYEVDKWTVNNADSTETGNKLTLNITDNTTVAVSFKLKTYSVTLNQTEGGTATASSDETTATALTNITFTATPETGWHFAGWKITGSETSDSSANPLTLKITGNTTVEPVFTKQMFAITTALADGSNAGTIAMTTGGAAVPADGTVPYGTTVTVTVTPENASDMVDTWTVNGDVKSQMTAAADAPLSYDVTVTEDTNVVVKLIDKPQYKVTISATGKGTANIGGVNEVMVGRGDSITATAAANNGSNYLKNWLVNSTETPKNGNTLAVGPVRQDTAIVAVFDELVRQKVMFKNVTEMTNSTSTVAITADGGSIKPGATAEDAALVVGNSKVVFTATVPANEMVGEWTINGVKQDNLSNTLTIDDLRVDTKVTVKFVPYVGYDIPTSTQDYTIEDIVRTPADTEPATQIRAGGTVEFVVKASDAGKSITGIKLNDCGNVTTTPQADGSIKVTVKNVKANIKLTNVTVVSSIPLRITTPSNGTITVKKGGTVLKNGDKVMEADELTITATPNSNYALDTLTVTGAEKQPNGAYKVQTGVTEVTVAATFKSTGGGGGGGGGGGVVSTYTLTFDTNGGSAIDKITKDSGTTIDLATYKPTRAGYTFAGWFSDKALTKAVTSVKLTANTTVYAKWTESGGTAQNPFVDVKEGAYYYDAVLWAVEQKITSGTSATTFSPDASCTRAQMVTFLWRAAGSPKVENGKNPFADVKADAYYYDAVLWAVEKGVTSGTSATTFSPDATVTRGQTVTFLYRNAGSPEVSGTMPFADVEADAYYAKAVQWAVQQKITTGTSETTFSPMSDCTRGQIVTFLYRAK